VNAFPDSGLSVLIVDDEAESLRSTELILVSGGIENIIICQDSRKVLGLLKEQGLGAVILDLSMPHLSGEELLPEIVELYPDVPVIIMTGANEVETAVACMRMGAFDYMVKPVEKSRMISAVSRALELRETRLEYNTLKKSLLSDKLEHPEAFAEISTRNRHVRSLLQYIETVAGTSKPILITGETGVGKELVAKAIHKLSGLPGEYVSVNVAGLDDNMFSDTLFGHVKGAYTGAGEARAGLVERASGGTLFLDEIGDLSPISQVKLLRLIQEREYMPLGADINKHSEARILASTNRSLEKLQHDEAFRKDLYYRLKTHHVHLPPLRDRLDDLPLLVAAFVREAAVELDMEDPAVHADLLTLLARYSFPGNIRELKSMIFDAVSSHKGGPLPLEPFQEHLGAVCAPLLAESSRNSSNGSLALFTADRFPTLREATQMLIEEALRRAGGNQTLAGRMLGITQSALSKRLKRADEK
jgi:DNA-binding NtrC family response regulator